jgi:hypothetical protein
MTTSPTIPLRLAAAWNILAACGALAAPDLHFRLFYRVPAGHDPIGSVSHYTLWLTVLVMGVCYAIAASDVQARRGILIAGAIGKTTACLAWAVAFALGIGTNWLLFGALGDLAWAAYFLRLLRRADSPARQA